MRGLVAFDLDGTLLRGATVCELLAEPLGRVADVWLRDKARWLLQVRSELAAAELRFFVGDGAPPPLPGLVHRPSGDIERIARDVLERWGSTGAP